MLPQKKSVFGGAVISILSPSMRISLSFIHLKIMRIKIMGTQENEKIRELSTLALLQDLWLIFYENVKLSDKEKMQTVDEAAQKRVQLMMQYIHENYNHEMSLDEIASHIGISKSTALNLFQRFLHTTPVSYLIGYRLQAASWLLKNTNKKVKTIAYESGFRNVDYFCRLFKKRYHLTPSEYRCACLKQYISK